MKKMMYEIDTNYLVDSFKVYKRNKFQRFLSSLNSTRILDFTGLALGAIPISLMLGAAGMFLTDITNGNIIAVAFSMLFSVIFLLSVPASVLLLVLDGISDTSLLKCKPLYQFDLPGQYSRYSTKTLENIINNDDFQKDIVHLLEIYNDIDKKEFTDILDGIIDHYETVNQQPFEVESISIKKLQAQDDAKNLKFKYDTLNEIMPKNYLQQI